MHIIYSVYKNYGFLQSYACFTDIVSINWRKQITAIKQLYHLKYLSLATWVSYSNCEICGEGSNRLFGFWEYIFCQWIISHFGEIRWFGVSNGRCQKCWFLTIQAEAEYDCDGSGEIDYEEFEGVIRTCLIKEKDAMCLANVWRVEVPFMRMFSQLKEGMPRHFI